MLKRDIFQQAMKAGLYQNLAWLIGAFSLVTDDAQRWEAENYSWRIVQLTSGNYVAMPDGSLVLIEDAPRGLPVFDFYTAVEITPDDIPTAASPITTSYGNWLMNYLLLYNVFGVKIPFMEGDITPDRINSILLKNFWDNPKSPLEEKPDRFYVHEYVKYVDALYFLTGMTQLCVWAATRKTLLPAPGINELKDKLVAENADTLNELATIAKIDKELVNHDLAYLKGDPGMNFLRGGKAIDVARKKKYGMVGAETGLDENSVYGVLIKNSLSQGWELDKFPIMNDSLRAGSYDRGAQTQLGGVSVKWLLRASANTQIVGEDCGSKLGISMQVTDVNKKHLVGFTLTDGTTDTKVNTDEEAGAYLGKTVHVRSPMFCRLDFTDFCKTCLGDRLSINPDGLSIAVSDMGSEILNIFLKKMHGKKLSTAVMDYKTAIQ